MVKKHPLESQKEILSNILIAILAIGIMGTIIGLIWPKQINISVNGFAWEYNIDIERYQTVEESGWTLPAGARLQYTRQEFYKYKDVLDHYETKTRSYNVQIQDGYEYYYTDNGDGTATEHSRPKYKTETREEIYEEPVYRQEPVYETRYYYEIDKWLHDRYITTLGNNKAPYWGEVKLLGEEREGFRSTRYNVTCMVDDQEETYTCSEDIWKTLQIDKSYVVKVSAGSIIEVIE